MRKLSLNLPGTVGYYPATLCLIYDPVMRKYELSYTSHKPHDDYTSYFYLADCLATCDPRYVPVIRAAAKELARDPAV